MNKTCVRSKDNLNSVGYMPMLAAIKESNLTLMKIKSLNHRGDFQIVEENESLLISTYEKNLCNRMTTQINGHTLTIEPKDNWQSSFQITRDGNHEGEILFNWNGDIILSASNEKGRSNWIVRKKGFWSFYFEVQDADENTLIIVQPASFNSEIYRFDYEIQFLSVEHMTRNELLELLTYIVFGINLYKYKQDNMQI